MKPQPRVSKTISSSSPNGGINDIDPYGNMEAKFCIDLIDMFPANNTLKTRKGYQQYAINMGAAIYSIISMKLAGGTSKLLASTIDGIYDITTGGDAPPIVYTGSKSAISYIQFADLDDDAFLIGCNGLDAPFLYDGTTFTPYFKGDGLSQGSLSGSGTAYTNLVVSDLSYVTNSQGRVWFIQKGTMNAWYLDYGALWGDIHVFPIGGTFKRGGELFDLNVWSFNAGNGLDDKLTFRTTGGEIAVYAGTDPEDAEKFWLESIFFIGSPVGNVNGATDFGGDVVFLSDAGLLPLSQVVQGTANSSLYEQTLTKNISQTLNSIIQSKYFESTWSVISAPILQALIIIIPATAKTSATQYVMNTITGAWSRYTLPAQCAVMHENVMYFGDKSGRVFAFGGTNLNNRDLNGEGGSAVVGRMFTAFNYFGNPTRLKHFKLIRPIFQSDSNVSFITQMNMDYDTRRQIGNPDFDDDFEVSLWDEALWDAGLWSYHNATFRPWIGVVGIGYCAALLMKITGSSIIQFPGLEIVFEEGNSL